MTSNFESAEIYIKELLSVPIDLAIKEINKQLYVDRVIPGLKLIVSGGQAIQEYFPNSKQLRTHDYDLKLVTPKTVKITSSVIKRMKILSKGIIRYFDIYLNDYISTILEKVKQDIKDKYGLMLLDKDGKVFTSAENLRNDYLNILTFKLRDTQKIRSNSLIDVYTVNPKEISEHYYTFTGLDGSNPILSEDAGDYYIPLRYINGIPYAGMGYVLWDTLRMVDNSRENKSLKYSRYVAKRDAIIQALNDPEAKLSCDAMKKYVAECESKSTCVLDGKRYETVNSLLVYAINEGLMPMDRSVIQHVKTNYDLDTFCSSIKRILN